MNAAYQAELWLLSARVDALMLSCRRIVSNVRVDVHATVTRIGSARDRLGEKPIYRGNGAGAGWYSVNHECDN